MVKHNLQKFAEARVPTRWGEFDIKAYAGSEDDEMPHIVLVKPDLDLNQAVTVRIHSECLTGDIFHSKKCDCGAQLEYSMQSIRKNDGILIYLRQEGRGIGIINKLKAYKKQEEGFDTIEANKAIGFEADLRTFDDAIRILTLEGVRKVRLLTNNPQKLKAFENTEIELVERLPVEIDATDENEFYLKTKKDSLGHLLESL